MPRKTKAVFWYAEYAEDFLFSKFDMPNIV